MALAGRRVNEEYGHYGPLPPGYAWVTRRHYPANVITECLFEALRGHLDADGNLQVPADDLPALLYRAGENAFDKLWVKPRPLLPVEQV